MKKIVRFMAMALVAFTFAGCEDVPSPYGAVTPPEKEEVVEIDPTGSGTEESPYNVAATLKYVSSLAADVNSTDEIYVKGTITEIEDIDTDGTYGNATYYISDDEEGSNRFEVYHGFGLGGQKFNAKGATLIQVGDVVVIKSKVVNYKGNTPETVGNSCVIVELNGEKPAAVEDIASADEPLSIAQALERINALDNGASTDAKAYVKGKVVKVTTSADNLAKYGNLNYYISEDGTDNNSIQVYAGDGLNGTKFTAVTDLSAGDEVVVYGNLYKYVKNDKVTPEITNSYLTSYTKGEPPVNYGTKDAPISASKAIEIIQALEDGGETSEAYVKGTISKVESFNSKYKSITYYISDDGTETSQLQVYSGKGVDGADFADKTDLSVGDVVVVKGTLKKFMKSGNVVPEINQSSEIVSITKADNAPTTILSNGDFEAWTEGKADDWSPTSSAGGATLSQSTDAHGGTYSVLVKGDAGGNKRIAHKEITLKAGTYTMAFYAKAATEDKASARPGYVPVGSDGKVGSYAYGSYTNDIDNTKWVQVSHEFTLAETTTVCVLVMNPKSPGKDLLIDDFTLVTTDGGLAE